ncbi:MAG: hypothetical protein AAF658_21615, partial [Myxococcota bacterium]
MEANRTDVHAVAGRLLSSANPEIRAVALRLIVNNADAFAANAERIETTDDPVQRGMVVLGRFNAGTCDEAEARKALASVFEEASGATLCGLAQAMRGNESAVARWALTEMGKRQDNGERHDESLCREIALSMAKTPHPEFLPTLVGMLGDRRARPAVREALVAIGPMALEYLEWVAVEENLTPRQMRHLPRSISPFGGQAAVDALVRLHRKVELGYFRFKVLRGLGRLVADDDRLSIDSEFLDENIEASLRRIIQMIDCRLSATTIRERRPRFNHRAMGFLIDTLRGKEINAAERLFRFLAIRYPDEAIYDIFKGLMSSDSRVRAGSRELLENRLDSPHRSAVQALVD